LFDPKLGWDGAIPLSNFILLARCMSLGDLAPTKLILPAAPVQEKFLHILPGQSTKSFDSKLVDFPTKLYLFQFQFGIQNAACTCLGMV
jgi:hypothetical protein